jgi:putative MFS transporter
MQLYGTTLKQAVTYMLYISMLSIVGRFVVYFLSEKVGRKFFIILGFTVSGIAICCGSVATTATQLFLLACLIRLFSEIGVCSATIYTPEVFPLHIRVLGASSAMGLGRVGGAVGAGLVGLFVGAGRIPEMWIFLGAGSVIMGLATIWFGIEPKGKNLEELNKGGIESAVKIHKEEGVAALSGK